MIKGIPVVTAIDGKKISFHVSIVDAKMGVDFVHTMFHGKGNGFSAEKIGEASVILQDCSETWDDTDIKVLYIEGYRYDGGDFCIETEEGVVEACKKVAKAIWE